MDLPADLFVRPVEGDDELVQFSYGFTLEGKAAADQTVTETEDGDLIIEGYAAVFDGLDRQNENFADGAFQRGIKSFLGGQASLCYHHKHDKLLGKVLDLREVEGKGLWMKARVDGAIKQHPELGTYYEQIRRGTLNALSVGGFFRRKLTAEGQKIVDMDFTEISTTPVPVHPGTHFSVVAGKALESLENVEPLDSDDDFSALVDVLNGAFRGGEKALPDGHEQGLAYVLARVLTDVQALRESMTLRREVDTPDEDETANRDAYLGIVDSIESDLVKYESKLHTLAAKVGPLPVIKTYVD